MEDGIFGGLNNRGQCAQPSSGTRGEKDPTAAEDVLHLGCDNHGIFVFFGYPVLGASFKFWDLLILMKQVCIQKLLRIKNQWPVKGKPIMSESPGSNPNQSNQVCANL